MCLFSSIHFVLVGCSFSRRHRCPHTPENVGPPLDLDQGIPFSKTTSQHEHFQAFQHQDIQKARPTLQRLSTQLSIPHEPLEATTTYQAEFEEKQRIIQAK